uniref:amidohydrolase n=1 Tax=Devosia sp. TaxID=1871048 RepID=UPI002FC9ACBD
MPVLNRIAEFHQEIAGWRQDFHAHPEILYDVVRTAGVVEQKLREFGCDEVVTGIGRTGVVGIINGRTNTTGRTIGLRADMDALPVTERTGKGYASTVPGKMHACGHDGHTAMLLGAAKYLTETRNFDGRIALIFQPAEEGGAGGKAMLADGLVERFSIDEFYGMHNWPGMPVGHFGIRAGGIMAATDRFYIDITGKGGHAARPQTTIDPIMVAANMIVALQSIVSRNVDPLANAVLSVTMVEAGEADNVISQTAKITGTVRTLDLAVQDQIEQRLADFVPQFAASFGAEATVRYARGYPVT